MWYFRFKSTEHKSNYGISNLYFVLKEYDNAEVAYWLIFLSKDTLEGAVLLQEADAVSPAFVFPFRNKCKGSQNN